MTTAETRQGEGQRFAPLELQLGETSYNYLRRLTENPGKEFFIDTGTIQVRICRGTRVGILGDHVIWIMVDKKSPDSKLWASHPNDAQETFGHIAKDWAVASTRVDEINHTSFLGFEAFLPTNSHASGRIMREVEMPHKVKEALDKYAQHISALIRQQAGQTTSTPDIDKTE